MQFYKYFYGDREAVVFVDESGHPSISDPSNPIFTLGGCVVTGEHLQIALRDPWDEVRRQLSGSSEKSVHMRELRRLTARKEEAIVQYFKDARIKRFSFSVTEKSMFDCEGLPSDPVLDLSVAYVLNLAAELVAGDVPIEAMTVIFEDGPFSKRIARHWPHRRLNRSDGVSVPVSWAVIGKEMKEPGLEVADVISHTAAGYVRHHRDKGSSFFKRHSAIFPSDHSVARGVELNKAELVDLKTP